jgi:peroxiredoxin
VKAIYPQIQEAGGDVLVISFTPPAKVAAYLAKYPMPFPVVSDPELRAYHSLGMGRTTWGSMLRPAVIGRYLLKMLRGWLPKKPGEGEDVLQLGGDFVLDGNRRLVYAHPSKNPTDRPAAAELLHAVRQARR